MEAFDTTNWKGLQRRGIAYYVAKYVKHAVSKLGSKQILDLQKEILCYINQLYHSNHLIARSTYLTLVFANVFQFDWKLFRKTNLHIAFTSSIISLYSFLSAFLFVRLFSVYYSWYLHICFTRKHCSSWRAFVVTSDRNHQKIHLFNTIQILNKFKIFKHLLIRICQ